MTILSKALHIWRGFTMGSVNGRIFHAMAVITAATIAVKVGSVLKDVVIAGSFGLGDALDAFLVALVIPSFATATLAQSFIGAFMPAFIRVREREGEAAAKALFGHVIILNFVVLLASTLVLAVAGPALLKLVGSTFSAEKLDLAYDLYLVLLPMVVLTGQASLWGAVLNAGEKFALVAAAPLATPLVILGALFVLGHGDADIRVVAWGTVVGCAAEVALIGATLARRGLLSWPRWQSGTNATSEVMKHYFPLVAASFVMGSSTVIDSAMASWLGSGAVAALNYGNKVPSFVAGIGVTAVGTAVLPHFARLVAIGDTAGLRHILRTYGRWIVLLSVPATAAFIVGSEWLVRLMFERGAFTREDTLLVALIQQMYFLQVPFFILGMLGVRLLLATSRTYLLTVMSVVNLAVNVAGNLIFMRWLGVSGIALSSSLVYVFSMTMIWYFVHRHFRDAERARA